MNDELREVWAACRRSVAAVGVFSLAINLLLLAPALYMLQVYDRVLASGSGSTLLMLSLIVLFLFATMGALEWVRSQIMVKLTERIDGLLGDRLFDISFRQALATGGQQAGAQPLQDLQGLRQFLTGPGLMAFFDAPWLPVYLLVMFAFHPWFGVLSVAAAILLIAVAVLNERRTAAPLIEAQREASAAQQAVGRTLRNAEAIEALGMLGALRARWRKRGAQMLRAQVVASERGGLFGSMSRVLRQLLQSAVLGLGAWLVLDGQLSGGLMIAGSILLGRALAPIDQLTNVWKNFVTAREQYRRLNEWIARVPAPSPRMTLPPLQGQISVEQLTVVPPGAKLPALRGVSFSISPGEVVGVIGPSAAGKSTLARTLLGVWPAAQGRVRFDGADAYGWDRMELGPQLGYLPQDIELFDGTIAENIARFGSVDADKVVEAAKLADVHAMILRLPQGYDTPITSAGGVLTGGQRQRLGLARAVYGSPKIVVLDEPNSNLDEAGDQALLAVLMQLKQRGTSVMVISHRTALLQAVDKLAVLHDGQLAAFGPRDEVQQKLRAAKTADAGDTDKPLVSKHIVPMRPPGHFAVPGVLR